MLLKLPLVALRALFCVLWSVLWISLAAVATVLTFNREVALTMARRIWAPGILWGAGLSLTVEPLPEVDWSQPHIFVMNHQSMLDIPAAFASLPVGLRFVAKHSLAYVPFLGWYMAMTGMIFINRANRRKAVMSLRKAGERIRQGANIIAFPEGTRSKDRRILPFKKGPFVVAAEARVPIIPVAVEGTGPALPPGTALFLGGKARLKVGTPIFPTEANRRDKEALLRQVRDAIIALHREIGGAGGDADAVAAVGQEGIAATSEP